MTTTNLIPLLPSLLLRLRSAFFFILRIITVTISPALLSLRPHPSSVAPPPPCMQPQWLSHNHGAKFESCYGECGGKGKGREWRQTAKEDDGREKALHALHYLSLSLCCFYWVLSTSIAVVFSFWVSYSVCVLCDLKDWKKFKSCCGERGGRGRRRGWLHRCRRRRQWKGEGRTDAIEGEGEGVFIVEHKK